jgi:hypothetical protein
VFGIPDNREEIMAAISSSYQSDCRLWFEFEKGDVARCFIKNEVGIKKFWIWRDKVDGMIKWKLIEKDHP